MEALGPHSDTAWGGQGSVSHPRRLRWESLLLTQEVCLLCRTGDQGAFRPGLRGRRSEGVRRERPAGPVGGSAGPQLGQVRTLSKQEATGATGTDELADRRFRERQALSSQNRPENSSGPDRVARWLKHRPSDYIFKPGGFPGSASCVSSPERVQWRTRVWKRHVYQAMPAGVLSLGIYALAPAQGSSREDGGMWDTGLLGPEDSPSRSVPPFSEAGGLSWGRFIVS